MLKSHLSPSKCLTLAVTFCLVATSSGCNYDLTWSTDSSGFVYTTPGGQLVRYDVSRMERRVLVENIKAGTDKPALSPDGKRIAVARLFGRKNRQTTSSPAILQVVVYDSNGKDLQRCPEVVWDEHHKSVYAEKNEEGHVGLVWGPKGQEDKLLIEEYFGFGGDVGIFDLKTNKLVKLKHGTPPCVVRPDGGGILAIGLLGQKAIAFADWQGNVKLVTEKRLPLEKWEPNKQRSLGKASMRWKENTFACDFAEFRLSVDTSKLTATIWQVEQASKAATETIFEQYTFPDGGLKIRVIDKKKVSGSVYSLQIWRPAEKQWKEAIGQQQSSMRLVPSPNEKLVAIREGGIGGSTRIFLVDKAGKLVKVSEN